MAVQGALPRHGSSGSIDTAVNNAIAELVPLIAGAPADAKTREAWLELAPHPIWHYRQYGVKALATKGNQAEATRRKAGA